MNRTGDIVGWILAVLLALAFLSAGAPKLAGNAQMVGVFRQVGLGQWLRYLTGILEVTGGAGVLIPRVRFWAALDLAAVMVGATAANLSVLHMPSAAILTIALLALALVLAWLRRPQAAAARRAA